MNLSNFSCHNLPKPWAVSYDKDGQYFLLFNGMGVASQKGNDPIMWNNILEQRNVHAIQNMLRDQYDIILRERAARNAAFNNMIYNSLTGTI